MVTSGIGSCATTVSRVPRGNPRYRPQLERRLRDFVMPVAGPSEQIRRLEVSAPVLTTESLCARFARLYRHGALRDHVVFRHAGVGHRLWFAEFKPLSASVSDASVMGRRVMSGPRRTPAAST